MSKIIMIIGSIIVVICYFVISRIRIQKRKNRIISIIRNDWNLLNETNCNLSYISELYSMYQYCKNSSKFEIDDITWNDFEMDAVFNQINYTYSTLGEIYLYQILRNPTNCTETLEERDRVIEYFLHNEEERVIKQYQLNNIGKFNRTSIYVYKDVIEKVPHLNLIPHIIMPLILLISIFFMIFNAMYGIIILIPILLINLLIYYKTNRRTELYLPIIMQIGEMLNSIKEMNDMKKNKQLVHYSKILDKTADLSRIYRRYFRLYHSITLGREPDIDTIYDSFIKPIFHIDIIVFQKLTNLIKRNMNLLLEAYETVGFLDSMISVAGFRHKTLNLQRNTICKPDLSNNTIRYHTDNLYNPLIYKPIGNSLTTTESVLITGSNATGKSTFLRTVGLNAILAQSIYTVCAKVYSAPIFKIISSMSLKDSILSGESYYMKEIKAIKRILDTVNDEIPILCCIDEVLRGTNTIERIAASSKILENLSKANALCFVASHDLELTYILETHYKNYHFQESVDDEGIVCDFKLYKDRSYTRNAINLLKFLGYSNDIIDDARKRAEHYINCGIWT